ncbi:MAG: hypothetical protein ACOC9T_01895 [Myxococcota bacterium]
MQTANRATWFYIVMASLCAMLLGMGCSDDPTPHTGSDGSTPPTDGGDPPPTDRIDCSLAAADCDPLDASGIMFDTDPQLTGTPAYVPEVGSPAESGGSPPDDGFFDTDATYVGAVEPGATDLWYDGWAVFDEEDETACPDTFDITADGDVETDTTWSGTVFLDSQVFVRDATLTIEPGTLICSDSDADALIVTTSGRLEAEGTADEPIVFTSNVEPGLRASGDWGGVVLMGLAPLNTDGGVNNIEGIASSVEGTTYGGDDPDHDCGSLRYVRIEYAGFDFGMDDELNSLTLGACGKQTNLEYIQTTHGLDDGIEFFGGTADLKYAVVYNNQDDGLDTDLGYTGRVQFMIIDQITQGDNGMEADNNKLGENNTPRSNPQVWNMTVLGGGVEGNGAMWRRGTAYGFHNGIISNPVVECIRIDGEASVQQAADGNISVTNTILHGC